MKRFTATLNDGSFINIPADSMDIQDNAIMVRCGQALVAYLDVSCVLVAHVSERSEK